MKTSSCNKCGMPIIWLKTARDKNIPVDPINVGPETQLYSREDHTCHFDTCPERVGDNGATGQSRGQDAAILTPFLQTKLLEYVNAIKAGGVGHKAVGKSFLELCEQAYDPSLQPKKPAAAPPPPQPIQDDFDDDIPF